MEDIIFFGYQWHLFLTVNDYTIFGDSCFVLLLIGILNWGKLNEWGPTYTELNCQLINRLVYKINQNGREGGKERREKPCE